MTGKETIDYNSACIGSMLSAILDLPFVSLANHLEMNGNTATIQREIEGGEETNEVILPMIISCQKGMAEQRIPNMRGIMAARTKPLKVVDPVATNAHTSIKEFSLPPTKTGVKLIAPDQMDELVKLLKEEAKVI
jgi:electron transfer flavoprotein beta subunit